MLGFLQGRLIWVRMCLLACAFVLVSIGIATIYAVGNPAEFSPASPAEKWSDLYIKQMIFALLGCFGFVAVNVIRYRRIGQISHWIYGLILVLLAYLLASRFSARFGGSELPFARSVQGVYRWIVIPRLPRIQPSEFCKLAYIVTLAWYLRFRSNYQSIKALLGPFVLTLVPIALILPEPDLGTVILLMPVFFTMLFVAGARVKHLVLIILLGLAVSPLFWLKMRPYQRQRISSVILQNDWVRGQAEEKPWVGQLLAGKDFSSQQRQRDHGYQLKRSKIAIATAGLTGHGHRGGDMIKYSFLPEAHNDFIFPTILQQWGAFGGVLVLGLYGVIVLCGLEIASHNPDPFGRLLTIGILTMLVFEVFVNVTMTMGLMPITGLTLPLVSYGGSSLMVSLMSIGLLNNVGRSRPFGVTKKV